MFVTPDEAAECPSRAQDGSFVRPYGETFCSVPALNQYGRVL